MLDPYTLWKGTLPSGDIATLLICPTQREVLAVLHMNDRMRRLEAGRTAEEAERQAWAILDDVLGLDKAAS